MNKYLVILFLLPTILFGQSFQLSTINSDHYTLDKYTGEVYQEDLFTGKIWKTNLNTLQTSLTKFPTLPVFANKTHKAVYYDEKSTYAFLYDFVKDTSVFIADSCYYPFISFSPNDEKLIVNNNLYNLSDLTFTPFYEGRENLELESDNCIIYLAHGSLIEFRFDTQKTDTLVITDNPDLAVAFSYNSTENTVYYSSYTVTPSWTDTRIHRYNKVTGKDSIIYSVMRDSPVKISGSTVFSDLKWTKDCKLLGTILSYDTITASDLYIYNTKYGKMYRLAEEYGPDYGNKYSLNWYGNKTLLYYSLPAFNVFGWNVPDSVLGVKEEQTILKNFYLSQNYPNPFNGSTVISLSCPDTGEKTLYIYNALGQIVKSYHINTTTNNVNCIIWEGTDNNGNKVCSGVYFAVLKTNNIENSSSNIIKMVLLK